MTLPSAVSKTRPEFETVSSAMQCPGVYQAITDGTETLCRRLVSADAGLEALSVAIESGIKERWPIVVVLPQVIVDGYLCNPD